MTIVEFFTRYATEESCKTFFKDRREQAGIECSDCGSLVHYWIEKESRWKCKGCCKSMSLKT